MQNTDEFPPELEPEPPAAAASAASTASSGAVDSLPPVPVTIVTGFLGAGKSTLLSYILRERHGLRIAVIENEFSEEVGIESLILKNGQGGRGSEEFFELSNGCLCCTMRDDLVATLDRLMQHRQRFDYVLIETSGLADPGPVATAFWSDSGAALVLDAIVCVVDAARIAAQASEARAPGAINEAAQQLAYADIVLLNKADTLAPPALAAAAATVAAINATARVQPSTRCMVDLASLLNQSAFNASRILEHSTSLLPAAPAPEGSSGSSSSSSSTAALCCAGGSGSHGHESHCAAPHVHDSGITTVLLRCGGGAGGASLDKDAFRRWVASLLWSKEGSSTGSTGSTGSPTTSASSGQRILRGKGVLALGGGSPRRFIFQSVEEFFDLEEASGEGAEWGLQESRESRVILIGWGLDKGALQRGLQECLEKP